MHVYNIVQEDSVVFRSLSLFKIDCTATLGILSVDRSKLWLRFILIGEHLSHFCYYRFIFRSIIFRIMKAIE
jgi:hypothetical protein